MPRPEGDLLFFAGGPSYGSSVAAYQGRGLRALGCADGREAARLLVLPNRRAAGLKVSNRGCSQIARRAAGASGLECPARDEQRWRWPGRCAWHRSALAGRPVSGGHELRGWMAWRDASGGLEHEDLDCEVGVDVVLAHEGDHLAIELPFHDSYEVVAHDKLEVVAHL